MEKKEKFELSIVIPTLGPDSLYEAIDSVLKSKGDHKIEIIIIGKTPDDRIKKYEKLSFFRHLPVSFNKGDLSEKRNLGFREASSEIVAFIDEDVIIDKKWISNGLRHFNDKKIGIVSGPGIIPERIGISSKVFGRTLSSLGELGMRKRYIGYGKIEEDKVGDRIIGCNMMIRKEVSKKIGGFDPDVVPGDEINFSMRAIKKGFKVCIDPEFSLLHFSKPTLKRFVKQIFSYGKGRIKSSYRGGGISLLHLIPAIMVPLIPLLFVGSLFSDKLWFGTLIFLFVYMVFIILSTIISTIQNRNFLSILLILTIPLMHAVYGIGEVYEILGILWRK